jgi:hypothetical protein
LKAAEAKENENIEVDYDAFKKSYGKIKKGKKISKDNKFMEEHLHFL